MIDGINIVTKTVKHPDRPIICFIIGCLLLFIGTVIYVKLTHDFTKARLEIMIGSLLLILIFITLLLFAPLKSYTEYKVTISENVKMIDFLEQYEILESKDDIYTIKERN